uniref:Uncharacterized protein n=1 Tax=Chromera velia CCMP2878 TaxID=1169474 RepID=A0A0G4HYN9_9ALVE|eukprot:Cvel_9522.t1-p1 / transcript=Cvel_9522.t1 / gene=Cvel_9522 / organism=Chromera_velia_CCMP2878 / gene_product=hypothetical protein / transcript_product=hypothetical protein / location=Cvel_scaffold551:41885-42595(-) / protein_length=237 / sequence_SO=supercontig / SO=protein_coding / is_pseudo=false
MEKIPLRIVADAEFCEHPSFKEQAQASEEFCEIPIRVLPVETFNPVTDNRTHLSSKKVLTMYQETRPSLEALRSFASFVLEETAGEAIPEALIQQQPQHQSLIPTTNSQNQNTSAGGPNSHLPSSNGSEEVDVTPTQGASHPDYPLRLNNETASTVPPNHPLPPDRHLPQTSALLPSPVAAAAAAAALTAVPSRDASRTDFIWIPARFVAQSVGKEGDCVSEFKKSLGGRHSILVCR